MECLARCEWPRPKKSLSLLQSIPNAELMRKKKKKRKGKKKKKKNEGEGTHIAQLGHVRLGNNKTVEKKPCLHTPHARRAREQ